MIRGYRGKRNSLQASWYIPLTMVEMDISHSKTASNFNVIKDARCYEPLHRIHSDFNKQAMALFISEVLYKTIADEEAHPDLYDYISDLLVTLNNQHGVPAVFAHYFLVHYTHYLGLFPNAYSDEDHDFFNMREGVFDSESHLHPDYMTMEESRALKELLGKRQDQLNEIKFEKKLRSGLLNRLIEYYKIHLLNLREIRSHVVLAEVLKH